MASLLSGLFGQQETPEQKVASVQDIINSMSSNLPKIQSINDQFNMGQAIGGTKAQLAGESLYDPNRAAIRNAAGSQILKNLQNPYAMPSEVSSMLRQQGFEQGALTGTGASNAAQANTARNYGLFATDLANSRIAQGAAYGTNTANLYQPQTAVAPGDIGNAYATQVANQNAINRYNAELSAQNARNLFASPLNMAGSTLGMMKGIDISKIFGNGGDAQAGVPYSPFGDYGGTWNEQGNAVVPQQTDENGEPWQSGLQGASSGAAMGTSIYPGWGTAAGAVLGGALGYFGNKNA